MIVALDISPLKSGHRFRGIGAYTENLSEALKNLKKPGFQIKLIEKGPIPQEVDLVHYPYFDLFFTTLPLKKPKKTVVTVHDVTPLVFPQHYPPGIKGQLKLRIQKRSLKGASAVICDSINSKKDIAKFLDYPPEKTFVVYLAASSQFKKISLSEVEIKKISSRYNLPRKFVLYVGDVDYNKNVLGLVAACKRIKVPLVMVGKQAAQKDFDASHVENQPLLKLIKEFGQDPEVLRLGFVPDKDLVSLYNLASVYCQPSFYEGFGLPVLEAMACGCPVVSSNRASLREVAGEAALLVDPEDIEEIARALAKLSNNRKLREDLIKKGFKQVKKFSWTKTAQETVKIYEKVFNG